MSAENLLAKLKDYMRIRHDELDETITDDIRAGALELKRAGVSAFTKDEEISDDALIQCAIRYYVMAVEDYAEKGEQYRLSYEKLRDALALSGEYQCETN